MHRGHSFHQRSSNDIPKPKQRSKSSKARHHPPPTFQCPPGIDPAAFYWFQSVDQDRSGRINSTELSQALVTNKMKQFNSETCCMLLRMFDKDKDGRIDVYEFSALWGCIQQWRQCFDSYDTDHSGNIDVTELSRAFCSLGYRLSMDFCKYVVHCFGRANAHLIDLDDFIQIFVMLINLTNGFREKDTNRTGNISLRYEEFLELALDSR